MPVGQTIPTKVLEYDALLDNQSLVQFNFLDNNGGSLLGYLTDDLEISDGLGKVYYIGANHANIERFYGYTFRQPYRNPVASDRFWDTGYQNAFYYNNIIDGINSLDLSKADEVYGKSVKAQALLSRTWWYFYASMIYGPVFKPGQANSDKVIPYRTVSDINAPMENLSTQQELFEKVGHDLRAALIDLPQNVRFPSRPNRTTGLTLMAYYHLFTKQYDSVAYYANLAWTAASAKGPDAVIYNYNSLSLVSPTDPVASLLNSPDGLIRSVNSREMLFYRTNDYSAGNIATSSSPSYPSTELISIFDKNNDLRYKWFFIDTEGYKTTFNSVTYDDGVRTQNFRGTSDATNFQNGKTVTTSGFTYPELLLIRAEGYARTGKLAEAISDVNLLRKYRYKTGTAELTATSQDEVIKAVLDERRRELAIGGIKRFLDLKRLSLDTGKPWSKNTITHRFDGRDYTATINSKDFTLDISNFVLQYNPQWGASLDNRPW